MKELNNKKVYQCEYCTRVSLSKGGIKTHEHYCKHNPNKGTPCASCKHLIKTIREIERPKSRCNGCLHQYLECDTGYTECTIGEENCPYPPPREVTFTCEVTGKKMYYAHKLRAMRKEVKEAILSRCDCPMPCECDSFEFKFELNLY